mmetsp:Transcript_36537/g.86785  ORF Transcript_36537/g.86785 Transcript_36537/m.86785 type:complete len:354 (+) Transcript_36537:109-1170(+)
MGRSTALDDMTLFMRRLLGRMEAESKPNTARKNLGNLVRMNGGKPFRNLDFLGNVRSAMSHTQGFKPTTVRTYIASALAALGLSKKHKKAKGEYKRLLDKYSDQEEETANQMSERQRENWVEWSEVERIRDELVSKAAEAAKSSRPLPKSKYEVLLHSVIAGLYTYHPPRRLEYADMTVVPSVSSVTDSTNFLVTAGKKMVFVFNDYKTSKQFGRQEIEVDPRLRQAHIPDGPAWGRAGEAQGAVGDDGALTGAADGLHCHRRVDHTGRVLFSMSATSDADKAVGVGLVCATPSKYITPDQLSNTIAIWYHRNLNKLSISVLLLIHISSQPFVVEKSTNVPSPSLKEKIRLRV